MAGVIEAWRDTRAAATRDIVTVDDYAMALSNLYSDAAVAWGVGPQENSWRDEAARRGTHSFEGHAHQPCGGGRAGGGHLRGPGPPVFPGPVSVPRGGERGPAR